jgi:protocatechuate 3,4-dioxygenase beta subunit
MILSRRSLVRAVPLILGLGAVRCVYAASPDALAPTPACGKSSPTPPVTEGPYFTRNSPERASLLEAGVPGDPMQLMGRVLSTTCTPVSHALLDFWQADGDGQYDNRSYRLRGHQFTDAEGRFRLETVVPGLYAGRARHLHVKVQAPAKSILTTQLFFPGERGNARDSMFMPVLLMEIADSGGRKSARFDFVVNAA